jgi:hypothetical protein
MRQYGVSTSLEASYEIRLTAIIRMIKSRNALNLN